MTKGELGVNGRLRLLSDVESTQVTDKQHWRLTGSESRMRALRRVFGCFLTCLAADLPANVALCASDTQAVAPLPEKVTIAIPDKQFSINIPPGLCRYPAEVMDRLTAFMDDQHVVLAAGSCADISTLRKAGSTVVSYSTIVSILKSDYNPSTRRSRKGYLEQCKAGLPTIGNPGGLARAYADLERNFQYEVSDSIPTGLLSADDYSVTSGILSLLARKGGPSSVQLQIIACLAPANIPILWLFQKAIPRPADNSFVPQELRDLSNEAQYAILHTRILN